MNRVYINGKLRALSPEVVINRQHMQGKYYDIYIEHSENISESDELLHLREEVKRLEDALYDEREKMRRINNIMSAKS